MLSEFATIVGVILSSKSTQMVYRELHNMVLERSIYFQIRKVHRRLLQGRSYPVLWGREGVRRTRVIHPSSSSKAEGSYRSDI